MYMKTAGRAFMESIGFYLDRVGTKKHNCHPIILLASELPPHRIFLISISLSRQTSGSNLNLKEWMKRERGVVQH